MASARCIIVRIATIVGGVGLAHGLRTVPVVIAHHQLFVDINDRAIIGSGGEGAFTRHIDIKITHEAHEHVTEDATITLQGLLIGANPFFDGREIIAHIIKRRGRETTRVGLGENGGVRPT